MDEAIVHLSNEDAELFKKFMQYHGRFKYMVKEGVFEILGGSATINFHKSGKISSIEKRIFSYPNQNEGYDY